MAVGKLSPVIPVPEAEQVPLVAALCAQTGLEAPTPPYTAPQLKVLIRASLQMQVVKYQRETNPITPPVLE